MIFIDWYLPGFKAGGPVRTCVNLVRRLSDVYKFYIVTRDTDLNETVPYTSVKSNSWNITEDGTEIYYVSSDRQNLKTVSTLLKEIKPHAIHLNSMFSWPFTMLPLLAVKFNNIKTKVVLGPRGMLSRGALEIKPLKKKLFLAVAKMLGLFNGVTWHGSTAVEIEEIYKTFGRNVKALQAIDLTPEVKIERIGRSKSPGELKLFFLGRVAEVKNLLQNIYTLSVTNGGNIIFDIYGPVEEPEYWNQCKTLIEKLPGNIKVNYMGSVSNNELKNILKDYHFLFLLTTNENYGHAIVESLISGCPVIISDRTPWRNLEQRHAGWDLDLARQDKINKTINLAVSMDQHTYNLWSDGAYKLASEIVKSKKAVEDNRKLFS